MFVNFQLSNSNSFGDKRGYQMYSGGAGAKKSHTRKKYLTLPKRL